MGVIIVKQKLGEKKHRLKKSNIAFRNNYAPTLCDEMCSKDFHQKMGQGGQSLELKTKADSAERSSNH